MWCGVVLIVLYYIILFVLYWGVCMVARQGRSGVMCLCLVVWNECSLASQRRDWWRAKKNPELLERAHPDFAFPQHPDVRVPLCEHAAFVGAKLRKSLRELHGISEKVIRTSRYNLILRCFRSHPGMQPQTTTLTRCFVRRSIWFFSVETGPFILLYIALVLQSTRSLRACTVYSYSLQCTTYSTVKKFTHTTSQSQEEELRVVSCG